MPSKQTPPINFAKAITSLDEPTRLHIARLQSDSDVFNNLTDYDPGESITLITTLSSSMLRSLADEDFKDRQEFRNHAARLGSFLERVGMALTYRAETA